MGVFRNLGSIFSLGSTPTDINAQETPLQANDTLAKSERVADAKSIVEDPLQLIHNLDYKEKPSSLTYDTLNRMATRNSVISSIVTTRVNQVSSFTQPARFTKDGVGFEITLRDPKAKPTAEQREEMLALETFIENCGYSYNPSRDSFDTLIRKIVRDSLIYDQMTFEIVPDRLGRPAEILAVDAATIRASSVELEKQTDFVYATDITSTEGVKWVQVINNQVAADFTGMELAFAVRNPRTDINTQPYGMSELETLVHQVTSHLWAEEYNSRYFSQGGTTKGILNLKGQNISREQLEGFRRQWTAQVAGVTGAWKTPVVSVDGLEYINVSQSNREMEYELWMNYLINICCAVYQIDPAEINFPNRGGSSGSGGGLGEGGIEDRLKNSKDKGLRPLLRFIADTINRFIVRRFSNDYSFNFVGLDPDGEASKQAVSDKQVRTYKTINEIRKEHDYDPIEGGDIILDQIYTQNLMQEKQNQMMEQQQQGTGEGMEGEGEPLADYGGDDSEEPEVSTEEQMKQQEDQAIGDSIDSIY